MLDALGWAYPYRLRSVPAEDGDRVVIDVHGAVARHWTIVRDRAGWDFSAQEGVRVVAQMRVDASTAWRLLSINLRPDDPQPEISADEPYATLLRDTRAIIGTAQTP